MVICIIKQIFNSCYNSKFKEVKHTDGTWGKADLIRLWENE